MQVLRLTGNEELVDFAPLSAKPLCFILEKYFVDILFFADNDELFSLLYDSAKLFTETLGEEKAKISRIIPTTVRPAPKAITDCRLDSIITVSPL